MSTTGLHYVDAENYCQAQGTGGHLASIHSRFELQFVGDLMERSTGLNSLYWIGLDSLRSQNVNNYSWIDGTALDFTNWLPGQPADPTNQPCACMWGPRDMSPIEKQLTWVTDTCSDCLYNLWFVCELLHATNPPNDMVTANLPVL
uniref:C-type lectin domain-containing protein n=1 Tax=Plectus sambesii TaxID=2011161 RepID=A0A914WMN6_9BILA